MESLKKPIRLWTIQPEEVWEQLRSAGEAWVQPLSPPQCLPDAYRFLRRNLHKVLKGYGGRLPWWFYTRKPDLRKHARAFPRGVRMVCLEVEVPAARAFVYPCWAWSLVYCGQYLALSRAEWLRWRRALGHAVPDEDQWPLPQPWRRRLAQSHQRLFRPGLPARPWKGYAKAMHMAPRGREAVVERLLKGDVRTVTRFRGTSTHPACLAVHRARLELLRRGALERRRAPDLFRTRA